MPQVKQRCKSLCNQGSQALLVPENTILEERKNKKEERSIISETEMVSLWITKLISPYFEPRELLRM